MLFRFTLPMAMRGLLAAAILGFTRAVGEFGATVMIAGNIPGRTRTLSLAIFHESQTGHDERAALFAGITVAFAFLALWVTEAIVRRRDERLS